MGSPKRSGRWSLRVRLLVLLLVPLFSLAALWSFTAFMASRDAIVKYEAETAYKKVTLPGANLSGDLQRERSDSAVVLGSGGRQGTAELATDRKATDTAEAAFRASVKSATAKRGMSPKAQRTVADMLDRLDVLPAMRTQVDARSVDVLRSVGDYSVLVDAMVRVFSSLIVANDLTIYQQGTGVISATEARELVSREDAVLGAALAAPGRKMTTPLHREFVKDADNERYLLGTALTTLQSRLRDSLTEVVGSPEFAEFRAIEDAVIAARPGGRLPARAVDWPTAVAPMMHSWVQADLQGGAGLADEAKPLSDRINFFLYLSAGLGLLAVVVSITLSVVFGRNLARELSDLQAAALDLAGNRLPRIIKRLRDGEEIDVAAETTPVNAGGSKEVSRVADALTTVQRTAVEAAVGEARLRRGINQVFLNLAWRSQSLLHRQLNMLDTMEKQAADPDILEDLFALDHLTTRMRRHAEGLAILSGATPARGWHNPVAIRDVLRAAIAEVEDYTRVTVESVTPVALEGSVVADLTHLLAELVDNATAFSPPTTQVYLRGEAVAHGYAVEVEDRGIGMNAEELAEANERLSSPPGFDLLLDSDRLGLFIVGRLAARHGIQVTLGPSPYGGARAVVLVPPQLTAGGGEVEEDTWPGESSGDPGRRYVLRRRPPAEPSPPSPIEAAPPRALSAPDGGGAWDDGARAWADGGRAWEGGARAEPGGGAAYEIYETAGGHAAEVTYDADDTYDGYDTYEEGVPEDDGWTDPGAPELPRRIRQASLAPQLRRDTSPPSDPAADLGPTARPPEETRSLMSSLQRGWQRGREAPDLDE